MASLLRVVAVIASLLLVVGFTGFVVDKANASSRGQVDKLADVDPTVTAERERERGHGKVRETIDDANDFLLKPFASLFDFTDPWPKRMVPTVLALLLYGGGLLLLANYLPKAETGASDWRTVR
jgi:hypothetical protein